MVIQDEENFKFCHSSTANFFAVQYFKENFFDRKYYTIEYQEKMLQIFLNFSKFHETKLIRKLVETLPNENVKNDQVFTLMNSTYKNILMDFTALENPTILVEFFEHDKNIKNLIGSPSEWLSKNFNITDTKSEAQNSARKQESTSSTEEAISNSPKIDLTSTESFLSSTTLSQQRNLPVDSTWQKYLDNNQAGKILYQIWNHREDQSVKAILAFTKIPFDEDFLLDLRAKPTFVEFLSFAVKKLKRKETKQIFFEYAKDIFEEHLRGENLKEMGEIWDIINKILSDDDKHKLKEQLEEKKGKFYDLYLADVLDVRKSI
jgi:hypothetical protein